MISKIFTVLDYSTLVAEKTLSLLEKDVSIYRKAHPSDSIYLDFKDTKMDNSFLRKVASICEYYDCICLNLNEERLETIQLYLESGYFIFQHIGKNAYVQKFKELVERADYPLLIWDQRHKKHTYKRLMVVQPLIFTETSFVFQTLNPNYVQPKDLIQAIIQKQKDIFKRYEVHLTDIDTEDYCFRFACNRNERATLDVLEGILTEQLPFTMFFGGSDT